MNNQNDREGVEQKGALPQSPSDGAKERNERLFIVLLIRCGEETMAKRARKSLRKKRREKTKER